MKQTPPRVYRAAPIVANAGLYNGFVARRSHRFTAYNSLFELLFFVEQERGALGFGAASA
jgi:hypothetical protein